MKLSILDASVQLAGLFVLGVAVLTIAYAVFRWTTRKVDEGYMTEPWEF